MSAFSLGVEPWVYGYLAACLLVAGVSKGLAGIGLPVLAVPFMTLAIDLQLAVKLMPVSLIASNVWQVSTSRQRGWAARAFWPVALMVPVGTAIGVYLLGGIDETTLKAAVGAAIIAFVAFTLAQPSWRLPEGATRWVGPVAGFAGGIVGGVSAIFAPPLIIFLLAAGVEKERFIAAIGVLYLTGSLALALFLSSFDLMDGPAWLWSAAAFVPVLLGQMIGSWARAFVPEATFRKIVLLVLIAAAANMIRSVF